MRLKLFLDERFGPRTWRAVLMDDRDGRAWCWSTPRKPTPSAIKKNWRTHGRKLFVQWDAKKNIPIDFSKGV